MFEINSRFDHIKANLICGAVVVGALWMFNSPVQHDPVVSTSDSPSTIVVEAGDFKTHYSLKEEFQQPFLVTSIVPQRRRDNPLSDHHSQFVTFSSSAARKYMKNYAGQTHCPARFMNRHAEHITLYAANSKISETLASWKTEDGSFVSNWEIVKLTGQCMDKRTKIEKDGEDITDSIRLVTLGRKASRDCHMIYVTEIERTDDTVQDFVKS